MVLGFVRNAIKGAFSAVGLDIARTRNRLEISKNSRGVAICIVRPRVPTIYDRTRVLDTYPPYSEWAIEGPRENYCIHEGYQSRPENLFFDDTPNEDEDRAEAYQFAAEVAAQEGFQRICDIGCGSGLKLMKYFSKYITVGMDLPETIEKVKRIYPDRRWMASDFATAMEERQDLVISGDMIEHLPDPDALLSYIQFLRPKMVVLSTPDRNLVRMGAHHGPPDSPYHVREWNMAEFHKYVSYFLEIKEHFITNEQTQCLLAVPK